MQQDTMIFPNSVGDAMNSEEFVAAQAEGSRQPLVPLAIICQRTSSLSGTVSISGSKNVGLKLLTIAPLFSHSITLRGVPRNNQVRYLLDLLRSFGVSVSIEADTPLGFDLTVHASAIERQSFAYQEIRWCRHVFLLAMSVLLRTGSVVVPMPGYSHYGMRPISGQLGGLRQMGVNVHPLEHGSVRLELPRGGIRGTEIFLPFPSNAVTEALLWAAVTAEGETTIHGAAQEPETIAIEEFFRSAGVKIDGVGTPVVTLHGHGLRHLATPPPFTVPPDRIEAATLAAAVTLCGGEVRLVGVGNRASASVRATLAALGTEVSVEGDRTWLLKAKGWPNSTDITTGPFPAFPTDALGPYLAVLSSATGTSVVQERLWFNRLSPLAMELKRLGAQIDLPNGQAAVIRGMGRLNGAPVIGTDPRATAALIIAGLAAEGQTVVTGVDLLDNAYDALDAKLHLLGANVSRTTLTADFDHHHPQYGRLEAF